MARAVAATFARRSTAIPETPPDALTDAFAADPDKPRQWTAFAANIDDVPRDLHHLIAEIAPFLTDVAEQARNL